MDGFIIQDTRSRLVYVLKAAQVAEISDFLTDIAQNNCQATAGPDKPFSFVRFGHNTLAVTPDVAQALLWGLQVLEHGPVRKIPPQLLQESPAQSA